MEAALLPPLPAAFARGADLDLLAPLEFAVEVDIERTAAVEPPAVDRQALAAALATANMSYGHPAAEEMAERLCDPATRVIVTGQQPGLLGGPLYTLSKAVAAARWAERLQEAGTPALAVFWVATEDHDFLEVSRAVIEAPDGPMEIGLGDDTAPMLPLGMRSLGAGVTDVLDKVRAANPGERYGEWLDSVAAWYRPDARFGEAFSKLLAGLLGPRCPLLLDSMLPALKEAEAPHLRTLVERREEVEAAFAARDEEISRRGYDQQVASQRGASPLFLLHGRARRRIEWEGTNGYRLRGEASKGGDVGELLTVLDENPSVVSPGVLARAAIQDAVLGSSGLVLGPGEVSYLPQVAPLYPLLGVSPPMVLLRPQALVLGSRQVEKLASVEASLGDLVAARFDLDRLVAGGDGEGLVGPVRLAMTEGLEALRAAALEIDPGLQGPWTKTSSQIDKALTAFAGRLEAAVARGRDVERRRVADLRQICRPLGALQERVISTAHYPGKFGTRFIEAYFEQLELDGRRLQVITP